MAWKKHFTTYRGQQSPLGGIRTGRKKSSIDANRFQNFLPEIYAGQPDRIQRYVTYTNMAADSEIATALDTIAEFSTKEDPTTELPFGIKWHNDPTESESDVVIQILKQWCRINEWNQRLFKTFRNTIMFGDQPFIRDPDTWKLYWVYPGDVVNIIIDESAGKKPIHYVIKNLDPNFETLVASDPKVGYQAGIQTAGLAGINPTVSHAPYAASGSTAVNRLRSNQETLVDATHVVHIAITDGMDAAWPFGNSVLDAVFKTYKQKELLEDSIIIYRVQRAPERRVFYIDVGDMPPHLATQHLDKVKKEIHQRRVPSRTSTGSFLVDSQYNPLGILEDFFFSQSADGRGSKVETLPGGESLGQIDDLKFFNNKLARGLRIPSSYLPTGPDDGTASYNDGRVGTAYIQEFRFSQYCQRLQVTIQPVLDKEFKLFLKHRGYQIDSNKFDIIFIEPQNFSQFREIEINGARIGVFNQIADAPFMSKRFAIKKYLQWTDDEIIENEKMFKEENPDVVESEYNDDAAGLPDVGLGGGPSGDFELDDLTDEETEGEEGAEDIDLDDESPLGGDLDVDADVDEEEE